MADDSKVRLWREPPSSCEPERWRSYKVDEFQEEWIARPAAGDEALLRAFEALLRAFEALLRAFEALLRALLKSSLDAGAWKARAEKAEAALAEAVKAERARIAKHLRHLGLAGPATQVERCPSCYDLGVVGAGDEPCTAVACDAHAAKVREDAARRAKA